MLCNESERRAGRIKLSGACPELAEGLAIVSVTYGRASVAILTPWGQTPFGEPKGAVERFLPP